MDISGKAILISVGVRCPTGNKKDKGATESVLEEFGALEGAGAFSKSLYGDALKAYGTIRSRVRSWVEANTLPWTKGVGILPSAKILDARRALADLSYALGAETSRILDRYDEIREEARGRLGQMFSEADYPSRDKLESKFGIDVAYYPIPTEGDFRINVGDEERAALEDQLRVNAERTMKRGIQGLWTKLHGRVVKLAEILEREGGKVRDDFLARTLDLCGSLKDLNLTGDPDLARMTREVETSLAGLTGTSLSESETQKQELSRDVDKIMASMSGFMGISSSAPLAPDPVVPSVPDGWRHEDSTPAPSGWGYMEPTPEPIPAATKPDYSGYKCVVNSSGVHYVMS